MQSQRIITTVLISLIAILSCAGAALAADRNGYTALYECRLGGPICNVDVVALASQPCDQTITPTTAPVNDWSAINWANTVICLAAGDYRPRGRIVLRSSGGPGSYKVIRYLSANPAQDQPWRRTSASQAVLTGIDSDGQDYWLVNGLTFNVNGSNYALQVRNGSNNIIANRIFATGGGYPYAGIVTFWNATNSTLQNSVVGKCRLEPSSESYAVQVVTGTSDIRVVNNELYDCTKNLYVIESSASGAPGLVIENNDIYWSTASYTDCSGNPTPNGACGSGEHVLNFKQGGSQTKPIQIIHNRIWGGRPLDARISGDAGGAEGSLIATSVGGPATPRPYTGADWFLIKDNILFDSQQGITTTGFNTEVRLDNHSVIGNILWKFRTYSSSFGTHAVVWNYRQANEFYLNTVIDSRGNTTNRSWLATSTTDNDSDLRCNVVVDSNPRSGTPGAGTRYDNNAYFSTPHGSEATRISVAPKMRANATAYSSGELMRTSSTPESCSAVGDPDCFFYRAVQGGTTGSVAPTPCTTLGCTYTDGTVTWKAVRGPYSFWRRLATGPEQVVIPYARPDASTPEAFGCPADFASRQGVGINDSPLVQ